MIEQSRFYRAVRQFAVTAPVWSAERITYDTKPDERYDLTLISQRVYGNRDEALAVMAAAGLDRVDQELSETTLVLPNAAALARIKSETGFTSAKLKPVR